MKEIKPFSTQFRECSKAGLHGKGEFKSFKKHPELLPMFPKKKLFEAIKNGELKGIQEISCLKFGGKCSSANKDCRKLRGYE